MAERRTASGILTGVSGEYFVAAELSRQGYVASITLRNTKGIDILASNADASKSVTIQVKTNRGSNKSWILTKKAEGYYAKSLFYVFVNLNDDRQPSFHVVPSKVVSSWVKEGHARWSATPGRGGRQRKDNSIRTFQDKQDRYLGKWKSLGL